MLESRINMGNDHLWKGPYIIHAYQGENSFILQYKNGIDIGGGPMNGRFLEHYISWIQKMICTLVVYILLFKVEYECQVEGFEARRSVGCHFF